jgi:multidrug efflux pump subunit AcrB
MGKVQQQFFPDSSRPEIMMDIWFPEGTSVAANEALSLASGKAFVGNCWRGVCQFMGGLRGSAFLPAAWTKSFRKAMSRSSSFQPKDLKIA